ncbi:K(+)-transporting ATPase subunit F [Conexibacter arvalis]|uniref:K+-transporting ATPase KdpF subunit n=1 Tax=Conexibacter arvalis TaxID=912552 RepID=A0A840ILN3_9ACTN|nr:K(+)-transporting ATPase subunit F [Conexibacter arvalis]MBB4665053.1 K+-transporting ATPase KdpF subunit [Conexibacter arvalis]
MSLGNAVGIAVSIALFAYLAYALLRGEKL